MGGNNELLSLTQPDMIRRIHADFLEAGADILCTNTFGANAISQADYGMEDLVYEMNAESVRLAREAAEAASTPERPRWVAGGIGPTNRTASISPDVNDPGFRAVTFDDLAKAYGDAARALIEAGCDLILVETIFDTLNAKAALYAIDSLADEGLTVPPLMISGTITDRSGRTLTGQTPEAFWVSMSHARPFSIGLNCALGAGEMRQHVRTLSEVADTRVSAYPNAGLPNEMGGYDETARGNRQPSRRMGRKGAGQHRRRLLRHDAGSHPRHRRGGRGQDPPRHSETRAPHAAERAGNVRGGGRGDRGGRSMTTGASSFINIGERTNVTGSARFKKLIMDGDFDAALDVARNQVENGAQIIDVNMDEGLLDSEQAMITFLNLIASEPDISRVPVMVDSSKFEVIEAGLKCIQGRSVVNSISLKEGEEAFLNRRARCGATGRRWSSWPSTRTARPRPRSTNTRSAGGPMTC